MRFNQWKEWFISNQNHFAELEWDDWRLLSNQEKRLIRSSIQQFQRAIFLRWNLIAKIYNQWLWVFKIRFANFL